MRDKILLLLKKNCFVSGEKLAKNLGISRTAIWKHIQILKNLGYDIKSVKNKGYQLISSPDIPISEEITKGLNTKIIGRNFFYYKSLDSTNTLAKQKIKKCHAPEGTIIVANVQTSGKGRKNRTWYSPEGGLWFSVILYPDIPPQQGMLITMISSISIAQAIKEITSLKPLIKWPNDILINGKKVCGILTELDAEMDRINYSVVGIGLNVNNTLDDVLKKKATSLSKETKTKVSLVKLMRCIIKYLDKNYGKFVSGDYLYIKDLWFLYSDIIGREILVRDENIITKGLVSDVDKDGCLILKTNTGIKRIISGDIEYT